MDIILIFHYSFHYHNVNCFYKQKVIKVRKQNIGMKSYFSIIQNSLAFIFDNIMFLVTKYLLPRIIIEHKFSIYFHIRVDITFKSTPI